VSIFIVTCSAPGPESRRNWRRDVLVFAALSATVTLAFAITPLDIQVARIFYSIDPADHWPLATKLPWSALYRMAPWITASLVVGALAAVLAGTVWRSAMWRWRAVFLLLCVLLGPGLLINAVFKDHWDRPRPRDIAEFGGPMRYEIAPLRGEGGASFPCGHCAVGFLYGTGWWIWRRRRPYWAGASLALGSLTGITLGAGRMAAGAHFLSDVVWSALLALGLAHLLYYYVLRIPVREARESELSTPASGSPIQNVAAGLAALAGMTVLLALFVTPHGAQLATEIPLPASSPAPRVLDVEARMASIEVVVVDAPNTRVSVSGELHGFGLPRSRLFGEVQLDAQPIPVLHYRIEQQGWFTDLDGLVTLRVPAGALQEIRVRIGSGNIKITDLTRDGAVRRGRLHLDLQTGRGHVQGTGR
jgi:lipid A 4'-phosphatase